MPTSNAATPRGQGSGFFPPGIGGGFSGGRKRRRIETGIAPIMDLSSEHSSPEAHSCSRGVLRRSFGAPSRSSGAPPRFSGTPSRPSGAPPRFSATPSRPSGAPLRFSGTPSRPSGAPPRFSATPSRPSGAPPGSSSAPSRPSGAPLRFSGTPSRPSGAPPRFSATPSRPSGAPPGSSGAPSRPSGARCRSSGTPSRSGDSPPRSSGTLSRPSQISARTVEAPPDAYAEPPCKSKLDYEKYDTCPKENRRSKPSRVWEQFHVIRCKRTGFVYPERAVCKKCGQVYSMRKQNTSALLCHIDNGCDEQRDQPPIASYFYQKRKVNSNQKSAVNAALVDLLACVPGISFNGTQIAAFKKFVEVAAQVGAENRSGFDASQVLFCPKTLTDDMLKKGADATEKIKNHLAQQPKPIMILFDGWTSHHKHENVLGVTTLLNVNDVQRSVLLALETPETMTADDIQESLERVCSRYQIPIEKVLFASDSCSANTAALGQGNMASVCCFAHMVQNALKAGMTHPVDNAIDNCEDALRSMNTGETLEAFLEEQATAPVESVLLTSSRLVAYFKRSKLNGKLARLGYNK
ncbi:hypothetical protein Pmar_PMAR014109 [Perkinsus marinus ATCC 50983]|uniref:BED-type domain-containing protein n=1 Tax=Perkinsus marinus (strain ATCC 50983 / TXsc) TaxID=423536 RepID=C5L2X0_PERM5|nr:hypothetical protein Pmar_PMAR014109 [Perkinsus marinus ATCC 50983]EER08943.1 hypothetical protein Pmar_PMAR014109 [Perkinsus marinus ATCC 50983]|eukprot:XP_002777127.1 hypothetical protein Pmar_PMAR014109 [Perkinsus marinus ATCC 50983]